MPPVSHRPPCPDCDAAVGTNRYACKTCNRFVSRVTRKANRILRDENPSRVSALHDELEREMYAEMWPDREWVPARG